MEYYSALKSKGNLIYSAAQMRLEDMMVSEISQS
jgi:hypothetical protein